MTNTAVMALEAGDRVAEELRGRLKMKGVLVEMAKLGQILELRCEMPQCYCPKGRTHFDPRSKTLTDWAPNPDHHPIPGGRRGPSNGTTSVSLMCSATGTGRAGIQESRRCLSRTCRWIRSPSP